VFEVAQGRLLVGPHSPWMIVSIKLRTEDDEGDDIDSPGSVHLPRTETHGTVDSTGVLISAAK
jgi:hypothetical protein